MKSLSYAGRDFDREQKLERELYVKRRMVNSFSGERPVDVSRLTEMPPHFALYKIGQAPPIIKETIPPPTPEEEAAKVSYAQQIIANTVAQYGATSAEFGQKRPVDSDPSHTAPEPLPLREDDEIEPSGPPKNIPSKRR
jgi:hypothetical protein